MRNGRISGFERSRIKVKDQRSDICRYQYNGEPRLKSKRTSMNKTSECRTSKRVGDEWNTSDQPTVNTYINSTEIEIETNVNEQK